MTAWPDLAELKQLLDVTSNEYDGDDDYGEATRLSRVLESAIAYIKARVGDWDEALDEPTPSQAQAALRAAELIATRPDTTLANDRTLQRLLVGSRRRFGVA